MARTVLVALILGIIALAFSGGVVAQSQGGGGGGGGAAACKGLPGHSALKSALAQAVADETSGLDFDMWATVVNRDGVVCAVAFSGGDRGAQWPGSRVISAQKANTANAFSLDGLASSTANLYSAVQPGGSLYGLQHLMMQTGTCCSAACRSMSGSAFDRSWSAWT